MPKVCPFLLIDADLRPPLTGAETTCLEARCAWYIFTENRKGCAVALLTLIRADFALVRFLTLGDEANYPDRTPPPKKGRKSG